MGRNKKNKLIQIRNVVPRHNYNEVLKSSIPEVKTPGIEDFQFLTIYSNWMKSIKIPGFNNMLKDESTFAKNMYNCFTKLIPTVNKESDKIFNKYGIKNDFSYSGFEHCHKIKDDEKINLLFSICNKIHEQNFKNVTEGDNDWNWYQLGLSGSIRIIGIYSSNNNIFYPLFIDWNHLIYPDRKHNQIDYKKFKFDPYSEYK